MKQIILNLIKIYQKHISSRNPARCRFLPTCSAYTAQVIEDYGLFIGGAKGLWRIIRCNPLNPRRYDPPLRPQKHQNPQLGNPKSTLELHNDWRTPHS